MLGKFPIHIRRYLGLSFISQAFTFAVPLLSALLAARNDISESQVSLLLMGIYFASGILQVGVGRLFDRGLYVLSLVTSFFSVALGLLLYIYCYDNLLWFVVGSSILLFGMSIVIASIVRAVEGSVPESMRGEVSNARYLVTNLGYCTAAILGFYFLKDYRNQLLLADMVTTLSVIIFLFFVFRNLMKEHSEKMKVVDLSAKMEGTFSVLRSKWKVFLGLQLIYIENFAHSEIQPILYSRLGLEPLKWTTYMFFFNTLTVVLTTRFISKWQKTQRLQTTALVGVLMYSLGHVLVPYFLFPAGIAVTTAISVLGEIMWVAPMTIIIFRQFHERQFGLAAGIRTAMRSFAFVFNPVLGFFLFRFVSDVRLGFAAIYGLLPLLAYQLIFHSNQKEW